MILLSSVYVSAALLVLVQTAKADDQTLVFKQTSLDATGEKPEICLSFDQSLDTADTDRLGKDIILSPAAKPTYRVEDTKFCIGNLSFKKHYSLIVSKEFRAKSGAHLTDPLKLTANFGERKPHVAVTGNGFIIPGLATTGLNIESVNVHEARIHVFRLRSQTTLPGASASSQPSFDLTDASLSFWQLSSLMDAGLEDVWEGTMSLNTIADRTALTAFPLQDIAGEKKPGLFLVTVEDASAPKRLSIVSQVLDKTNSISENNNDNVSSHWVNLSDIGITLFRGTDGITVRTRSLEKGVPLERVSVTLQAHNGVTLGTLQTDASGAAHFGEALLRGPERLSPALVLAQKDGDFGFQNINTSWFDFSGRGVEATTSVASADASGSRALIQTDRGIYRSGETIHTLVILRDHTGKALRGAHPTLSLVRPDGTKDRSLPLTTDQDGGYVMELPLAGTAPSGTWTADVRLDPSLPAIGEESFIVHDFVPQTISVHFTPPVTIKPEESVHIPSEVRFLYGAPGAGLQSDGDYKITPAPAPMPEYNAWSFGLENESIESGGESLPIQTADQNGKTDLTFTPTLPDGKTKPLQIEVTAGFFDPAGHRVAEKLTIPVRRSHPLIGMKVGLLSSDSEGSQPVPIDTVLLSPDNAPLAQRPLHWAVARINRIYNWSFSQDTGWTYTSHSIDVPVRSGDVITNAQGRAQFSPSLDEGEYRAVVSDASASSQAASSVRFSVGWMERSTDASTPDRLPVSIRDAQISSDGHTVMHIGRGFAGKAEIVLATDHIISSQTVDVPKDGRDITLSATPSWQSGVYALVTLYRPLNASDLRPHDPVRAVGVAWIGVDQSAHHLDIDLKTPQTFLPRQRVTVPVSVRQGQAVPSRAHIVVSAVDEGILGLTHFKPLDMFDAIYGKPPLRLDMLDNYGALLLTNAKVGRVRVGGDVDGDAEEGANLSPVRTTRSVALFDGPVTLDASGHGQVTFDIPDFNGQLRLMATAWTSDAVGNRQSDVITRDPIFPELGLPRFLAPGDTAQATVSLVNASAPAGHYVIILTTGGAIHSSGTTRIEADLAPGNRRDFQIPLTASRNISGPTGTGTVSLSVRRLDAPTAKPLIERSWPNGIRVAHLPVTTQQFMDMPSGETRTLDNTVLTGFNPSATSIMLGLSAVKGVDSAALLQSFPTDIWGSADDIATQARGLLQVKSPGLLGSRETAKTIHDKITSAIETLFNRQDASGRIGQWERDDGNSLPSDTAFLADFLFRAKDAGYHVPEDRLNLLLDNIETEQVQSQKVSDDEGEESSSSQDMNVKSYVLYILAKAGRPHTEMARNLGANLIAGQENGQSVLLWADASTNTAQATPLALGHLAVALIKGDVSDENGAVSPAGLFEAATTALGPVRQGRPGLFDFDYWTYIRNLAGLAALAAEAHDDVRTDDLLKRFALLTVSPDDLDGETKTALLEAVSSLNSSTDGRRVVFDNKELPAPLSLPMALSLSPAMLERHVPLQNTGSRPLYASITLQGTPAGDATPLSHGLSLTSKAYTLNGNSFDLGHMHRNDRFILCFEGYADQPGVYPVRLTSLLPAGWEVESTIWPYQTSGSEDEEGDEHSVPYAFLGPLTATTANSLRDDRIVAALTFDMNDFQNSHRGFRVAYLVRAVTSGHFALPETVIRGEKRPALMARTASGATEIAPH